jgi:hypothetical protein
MNDSYAGCSLPSSRFLFSGDIGLEMSPCRLKQVRARFLYLVFAQKTDFYLTLSDRRKHDYARECVKWLIRLDGLGGVW